MKIKILIFLILFAFKSFAFDFKVNGLYYDIESRDNHTVSFSGIASSVEDLIIPAKIVVAGAEWDVISIKDSSAKSSSISTLTVSDGIQKIESFAFSMSSNLQLVKLPSSVRLIDSYAFSHCKISDLIIEESTADKPYLEIGNHAFEDNNFSILRLNNVDLIRANAFQNNKFLTTVYLRNCSSVREDAFLYDYAIKTIVCENRNVTNLVGQAFPASVEYYAMLYVPTGSLNDYKTKGNWSGFANNIAETNVFDGFDSFCMYYDFASESYDFDIQPYLLVNGISHNKWSSDLYSPGIYILPGETVTFNILPIKDYHLRYADYSDADVYAKDITYELQTYGTYVVEKVNSSICIYVDIVFDGAGVDDVTSTELGSPICFYNLLGIESSTPFKGINIVKYSTGETKLVRY